MPALNVCDFSKKCADFSNYNMLFMSKRVDSKIFKKLIREIEIFIFDADGVLWLGESAIPGSLQFIDYLLSRNKKVIVLTNNATKSRAVYAKKLAKLGYDSRINKNTIVNPAAVVADTLQRSGIKEAGKKVYLIGGQGVKDELDDLEIEYFGDGRDPIDNQESSKNSTFLFGNFSNFKKILRMCYI